MKQARLAALAALAVSVLATGCPDNVTTPPGSANSSLTVSNADPTDGNGALDPSTATIAHYTNEGVEDLDKVTLSAYDTTGTIAHEIEISWLPATTEVKLFQHFWGPVGGATSGQTRCAAGTANVCASVSVDQLAKTLTCNGVVLLDVSGGSATSTVTGTVRWGVDQSTGGDH